MTVEICACPADWILELRSGDRIEVVVCSGPPDAVVVERIGSSAVTDWRLSCAGCGHVYMDWNGGEYLT